MDHPEFGDIVRIKSDAKSIYAGSFGTVSDVREEAGSEWTSIELDIDGQRLWFARLAVDYLDKARNPFRRARASASRRTPCRLFVTMARQAPVAVVIRRGPTEWVQIAKWDTASDRVELGQWFHGRLYELRGDLSPDGSKMIYFAAKQGGGRRPNDFYAWTAISKPPYLTALALWPKRLGTWFGGGLFQDDSHVWLNHAGCESDADPEHQPQPQLRVTQATFDPRYPVGFYRRLHRDGWQIDPDWWRRYEPSGFVGAPLALHEKPHPRHPFHLIMETDIYYRSESPAFTLRDDRRDQLFPLDGVLWADWDQQGRLVYAKEGKLFTRPIDHAAIGDPIELADFNNYLPEHVEAPAWARAW